MPFPVDQSFLAEKLYRRPSFVIAKRAVLVDRGADATLESKKIKCQKPVHRKLSSSVKIKHRIIVGGKNK